MPKKSRSKSKKSPKPRRCIYISGKTDKQCSNKEVYRGVWVCNKHMDKMYNLQLKKSAINGAGLGLFAGKHGFKKGDIVGEYSRYDMKQKESKTVKKCNDSKNEHKCWEYVYCDDKKSCWDARYTTSVIVRHANDSRNKKNNASFKEFGRRVFMVADKNILVGTEVFCDYGDDYDWSFLNDL